VINDAEITQSKAINDLKSQIQAGDVKLKDLAAQRKTVQADLEAAKKEQADLQK